MNDHLFARRKAGLALFLLVWLPAIAIAAGDVDAGRQKAVTCAACHGPDGNSANPEWPSLAGQHQKYIVKSLRDFKQGRRENVLMSGQAMALSEQDIEDLAAYFSAQPRKPGTADPALLTAGERLYRGGDIERGISACIACHGPHGSGNPAAAYPVLRGQHATYTAAQLQLYRSGARASDPNQMMRNIAERLSDEDIQAVASYIQGLR